MKILWIFFRSSQNWTIFRGNFYAFKVNVQNGDFLGGAKISNIFLGCLKFLIFFGGEW